MYRVRIVSGYAKLGEGSNIQSKLADELERLQDEGHTIINVRYTTYEQYGSQRVNAYIHYLEEDNIPF